MKVPEVPLEAFPPVIFLVVCNAIVVHSFGCTVHESQESSLQKRYNTTTRKLNHVLSTHVTEEQRTASLLEEIKSLGDNVHKQTKLMKGLKSYCMWITWQRKIANGIQGLVLSGRLCSIKLGFLRSEMLSTRSLWGGLTVTVPQNSLINHVLSLTNKARIKSESEN